MKWITLFIFTAVFAGTTCFISCKKEKSCEGCINGNRAPNAVAGPDQVITLPTDSISLDGSASNDPDGTISEWLWTKISGPASFNIVNTATAKTVVKNLDTGTYRFELKVTDNGGLSAKDTMQVIINDPLIPNRPPVANAGADQIITLPINTITLNGTGSTDPDNNITSYLWTKISGPSSFTITTASAAQTQVSNLVQGAYQFELKITDAAGLFTTDTAQITVNEQTPPQLPQLCDNNRPQISAQLIPFGTLSQARSGMTVSSAGNKILFAGGYVPNIGQISRVDIYDLTINNWSTAELNQARYLIAAVASGNKIFFGGGYSSSIGETDLVDIYDASDNTWTIDHLSLPRDNIAAATVGNKVFFAGGYYEWDSESGRRVDIYDMTTQIWSTGSLSQRRDYLTAVTANNKIFFAGGESGDVYPAGTSDRIDIYNNANNSWSISSMVEPKYLHAAIGVADKICWAGGNYSSCAMEIRDAITGNSSIQYLSKPQNWSIDWGQNAVVKNNQIIFYRPTGIERDKFDIYDIATNSWSIGVLLQPIPDGASIISVNNTIYIAGGSVNGVYSNQVWKLEF